MSIWNILSLCLGDPRGAVRGPADVRQREAHARQARRHRRGAAGRDVLRQDRALAGNKSRAMTREDDASSVYSYYTLLNMSKQSDCPGEGTSEGTSYKGPAAAAAGAAAAAAAAAASAGSGGYELKQLIFHYHHALRHDVAAQVDIESKD